MTEIPYAEFRNLIDNLENVNFEDTDCLFLIHTTLSRLNPDVNIVLKNNSEKEIAEGLSEKVLLIILNHSVALWFLKVDGKWKYDGWEAGNYPEMKNEV
ncbi:MAG: hypothetical protein HXS54_05895 [Theionarchaea archaeon]|nr:hypothetical protein [Theionarchaea archaeon]DBA34900.1 TPA_asm: hypothetical protein vir521_00106 [Caudoviricetes sp. vir521]